MGFGNSEATIGLDSVLLRFHRDKIGRALAPLLRRVLANQTPSPKPPNPLPVNFSKYRVEAPDHRDQVGYQAALCDNRQGLQIRK